MTTISLSLAMVEREVRDIPTSLLVSIVLSSLFILLASSNCKYDQLLIESVHQRKLTEDLHESQEIVDRVLPQQSCMRLLKESIWSFENISSRPRPRPWPARLWSMKFKLIHSDETAL
jgi:hypothetical protein